LKDVGRGGLPQDAQVASVRLMKKLRSVSVSTASAAAGAKKLGQPVPDSNLVSERKSGLPAAGAAIRPPHGARFQRWPG